MMRWTNTYRKMLKLIEISSADFQYSLALYRGTYCVDNMYLDI